MIKFLAICNAIFIQLTAISQPYLDIANTNYFISPAGKLSGAGARTYSLSYVNAGANIPFQLKKKNNIFLVSPFFEQWQISFPQTPGAGARYSCFALPLTYIHPFNQQWKILYSVTPRLNYASVQSKNILQLGGAVLVTRQFNTNFSLKGGLYCNSEFFGVFLVPLVGIDWAINDKNKLFGVLPNSITYEHKGNNNFYYGAAFHAITNSYRLANGAYVRIDDNRIGFYADAYFSKNAVFSIESGCSILRNMQLGQKNIPAFNVGLKDNYYCKMTLAFRFRLDAAVKH